MTTTTPASPVLDTPTSPIAVTASSAPGGLRIGEHPLRLTVRNTLTVTRREVRDSFRDWRIMGPIFILTLVFPALAQGATGLFVNFFEENGAQPLVANFLPLLPMIIGFFPISISLVIALETFVGEKERRSLEPLLSTPLTNTELYVGKTLAAMLPPLLASYLGIGIYLAGLIFGAQQWRPEPLLIIQILLLTTSQALVMVTGAVVVSSQATSTRAANLLASFIIVPISLLVMFESYVMITDKRYLLWYILIGLILVDLILFTTGARIFNREELLGRQLDEINLRWAWRQFRRNFVGGAQNVGAWYRESVFPALGRIRNPAIVIVVCAIGAVVAGYAIAHARPDLQLPLTTDSRAASVNNINAWLHYGNAPGSVINALETDVRLILVGTLLAVFSFGSLGVVIAIAPLGILGFMLAQPVIGQIGVPLLLAGLLPHSLIEVPAMLVAGAAALRLGAIVVRPPEGKTVGEAWLGALADCAKIDAGIVLPLLIVAIVIEVYLTPLLVRVVSGG